MANRESRPLHANNEGVNSGKASHGDAAAYDRSRYSAAHARQSEGKAPAQSANSAPIKPAQANTLKAQTQQTPSGMKPQKESKFMPAPPGMKTQQKAKQVPAPPGMRAKQRGVQVGQAAHQGPPAKSAKPAKPAKPSQSAPRASQSLKQGSKIQEPSFEMSNFTGAAHGGGGRASGGWRTDESGKLIAPKKTSRTKRIIISAATVIGVSVIALGLTILLYSNSINKNMGFESKEVEQQLRAVLAPVENKNDPFYMLLFGSDAREIGAASRSDTIILLRCDPSKGLITMISIPRDTKVDLPGYGTQKINAAYAYGGPTLATKTISEFAGVPISHYAEIHFTELKDLVDSFGGIDIEVKKPLQDRKLKSEIPVGMHHFDGEQALDFVRSRSYVDGDFSRTANQRLFMIAMFDEILGKSPGELPGTVQAVSRCVSTDLKVNDILGLVQQYQGAEKRKVYSAMVPSTTKNIDGVSYVVTKGKDWEKMMEAVKAGEDPEKED